MKLRKIKLILLSICNLITVTLSAQSITNVQSHQEGNNIVVTYTLQSSAPVDIVLSLSKDGGATFTEPLKSVTGDIGEDISAGNRSITWNVLQDQTYLACDNVVFKVNASTSRLSGFTDSRDGHVYKTVRIGNQTWMAENLAYKVSNGCWAYENKDNYVDQFGFLYNWQTAQNVCPAGWHLPSDKEWETLAIFVNSRKGVFERETDKWIEMGKYLKATYRWNNNENGDDYFGFTGLPGGYRSTDGSFTSLGMSGYWWSSTEYGASTSLYRRIDGSNYFYSLSFGKRGCFSVRCIKD